ncbi:MAG: hypothetical protein EZS28_017878 [Streblomastix strix]|uniref:Uncharacterized protein n=1 Tax=Streblomastix strix TaxID=222440 RepID=A0A5J4VWP6_9EUKA|nr:MAG: hypothetical protein EZS28_017878 [Streblomastix strix]
MKRCRASDLAGTLQPKRISFEISLLNREEVRTDEDGYSGRGRKDQRNDIQREREWNGRKDQQIYKNMEIDREKETSGKQGNNTIQKDNRRERRLSGYVEGRNGRKNSNIYLTGPSGKVEPCILNNEIQWKMEKDSGCEQVEQGNRKIIPQDACTRGSLTSNQRNGPRNFSPSQIYISPHRSIFKLYTIPCIQLQQQQLRMKSYALRNQTKYDLLCGSN